MTPREHVLTVLQRRPAGQIPFTMYEAFITPRASEREMRNRGMCIVDRRERPFKAHRPNVNVKSVTERVRGKIMTRTYFETPVGTVSELNEPAGFTSWHHEKFFKSPDDYKVLEFILKDEVFQADYGPLNEAMKRDGGDSIFRAQVGLEPLQTFISGRMMKMEDFCIQWMENRDEILKLYRIVAEKHRELYPILAESPVKIINYGGNVVSEIIGEDVYRQYYLPHYREAADYFRKHGKMTGCHLDSNNKLIARAVAESGLDYIEAFTPSPDTDMTLAEARTEWPDMILWLNFPSSVHLKTDEEVRNHTVNLLNELDSAEGVIMGITENIPENRGYDSCLAIMDGLEQHHRDFPGMYPAG
ncbi:MAG: uroporphyrinogen decarboxylase family protein [Spirochaetia bacterium]